MHDTASEQYVILFCDYLQRGKCYIINHIIKQEPI